MRPPCKHSEGVAGWIACFEPAVAEAIEAEEGKVDRYSNTPYEFSQEEIDLGMEYSPDIPPYWNNRELGAPYVEVPGTRCQWCPYYATT